MPCEETPFTRPFLDFFIGGLGSVLSYSYTIALSGLFELYTRGRRLNHEAKLSGLKHASSVQSNKPRYKGYSISDLYYVHNTLYLPMV